MKTKNYITSVFSLFCLVILATGFTWSAQEEPTVEELIRRSQQAFRQLGPIKIHFETEVKFPGSNPGIKNFCYRLGKANQALIEIGTQFRIQTSNDKLFVENLDVPDRYLEAPFNKNLAQTLALVRGRSRMAGLREPPQNVLREGRSIKDLAEALRFSNWLGELTISGPVIHSKDFYELTFNAGNGSCRARFNSNTYILEEVEYLISPGKGPKGYQIKVKGRYKTTPLTSASGSFAFNPGERKKVMKLKQLSAQPPGIKRGPETVLSPQTLAKNLITIKELGKRIEEKQVLLIGEDHLYHEPPLYLCGLLEVMKKKPIHMLLELPHHIQPEIDTYMKDGSEAVLKKIFFKREVLQLQDLLRWAFKNRQQIKEVSAIDEPLWEIMMKRSYLEDTRNPTMAAEIFRTWKQNPGHRIIFYAGQLHLLKKGRYKEDRPSRDTAGSRLTRLGIPEDQIVGIMLNGNSNFHLHSIWQKPGALPLKNRDFRIPVPYLIDYPIFGAKYADQFFDYFVNLGKLTRVKLD